MPVDYSDPEVIRQMSFRAKEWARWLETNALGAGGKGRIAIAFGQVREQIYQIIQTNLLNAVAITKEYDTPELSGPLVENFSDPELVKITNDGEIYFNAEDIAGNWNDFNDGVQAARHVLKVDTEKPIERRAHFWKVFVYQPAREGIAPPAKSQETSIRKQNRAISTYYPRAINVRMGFWRGKTPYWLWLEVGNHNLRYRYPRFAGTHFLENSRKAAQQLFDAALEQVRLDEEAELERAADVFFENPQQFVPEQVLGAFYDKGRKYEIYITPKRQLLGVRLV